MRETETNKTKTAFAAISQKTGHTFSADQSEKITDGIRGAYEKATGNKVDAKYSN
jgi:hypothetical protein